MGFSLVPPKVQFFNSSGDPLDGGALYTKEVGGGADKATYSDALLTTPNANPVVLNARGEASVYAAAGSVFWIRLNDADGVTIWTADNQAFPNAAYSIPIATSETAASVTPTDLTYPVGDVRRYGAVGDGSANDTVPCQTALNVAKYSGFAYFNPVDVATRTIYVCDPLTVYEGTTVAFGPNTWVRKNSGTGSSSYLFANSAVSLGTTTLLTASANPSNDTLAVTSISGFSAGSLALLRDATYAYGSSGRNQEIVEVLSVAGTTVTLKGRVIGQYAIGNTPELIVLTNPARNITYINARAEIVPGSGVGGGLFRCNIGFNQEFRDCEATGSVEGSCVNITQSTNCRIVRGYFRDGQNQSTPGQGYAWTIGNASKNCHAVGVRQKSVRESALFDGAAYCSVKYCESEGCYDSDWNTHAQGVHDCEFAHNISWASRAKSLVIGFTANLAGDYRNWIHNNQFFNCAGDAIQSYASVGYENYENIFENNFIDSFGYLGSNKTGIFVTDSNKCVIRFNTVYGRGNAALNGIFCRTNTETIVQGNYVYDCTSIGIRHDNCTGIVIKDNDIHQCAVRGIHADTTTAASTAVKVLNNTVDDDNAFTRVSGDLHVGNVYATKFDEDSGVTSVADGGTIAHNCIKTPVMAQCTPVTSGEFVSVTALAAGTITVAIKKHDNSAGTTQNVYWEVRGK